MMAKTKQEMNESLARILRGATESERAEVSVLSVLSVGSIRSQTEPLRNFNKIDSTSKNAFVKTDFPDTTPEGIERTDITDSTDTSPRKPPGRASSAARRCDTCRATGRVMLAMAPGADGEPWFLCSPCWRHR